LDEVLAGGIPEYSFNLIDGAPGTSKTRLARRSCLLWPRPSGWAKRLRGRFNRAAVAFLE
jgi:hypothetical protein